MDDMTAPDLSDSRGHLCGCDLPGPTQPLAGDCSCEGSNKRRCRTLFVLSLHRAGTHSQFQDSHTSVIFLPVRILVESRAVLRRGVGCFSCHASANFYFRLHLLRCRRRVQLCGMKALQVYRQQRSERHTRSNSMCMEVYPCALAFPHTS